MKIESLQARVIDLPFRFAFKHSLASRKHSENLIVTAVVTHAGRTYRGYGEGIPRDYVTGESVETALVLLQSSIMPAFQGREYASLTDLLNELKEQFQAFKFDVSPQGSAFCALELALLDAWGQACGQTVTDMFGGFSDQYAANGEVRYGAVIPFGKESAVTALLWFYRLYGFSTVKLKVGKDDPSTIALARLARTIMGENATLRIDANCAWSADQTLRMAEAMRPYRIASIEQPVGADRWQDLAKITAALPEKIMVDESLCTIEQARQLAEGRVCSAFNIRLSKVGGILAGMEIVKIAKRSNLAIQLGAQVGESGILSAAGRAFALIHEKFDNYEGSNNFFLLKNDITVENLNVGCRGCGRALPNSGLGVTVQEERLEKLSKMPSRVNSQEVAVHSR